MRFDGHVGVVTGATADVSVESELDDRVARAVEARGRIDLFSNNAGIEGRMAPMTELSVAARRWRARPSASG